MTSRTNKYEEPSLTYLIEIREYRETLTHRREDGKALGDLPREEADAYFKKVEKETYNMLLDTHKQVMVSSIRMREEQLISQDRYVDMYAMQQAEFLKRDDHKARTPITDAIAAARGITREALFDKIAAKLAEKAVALGALGKKRDGIKAAKTFEEVDALMS